MTYYFFLQYFAALIKNMHDNRNGKKGSAHNVYEKSTVEIYVLTFLSRLSIMVLISAMSAKRLNGRHNSFGRCQSRPS